MAKRWMKFEIKEITNEGSFEGLLSPYGNVDYQDDVVEPGAYTKTIQEHGSTVPMLWQHKSDTPVGTLTLDDRPDGLWCRGQLLMALPDAQKAYLLIKARIVRGLSIGFDSVKDSIENGIRHLKEIRLWEGSIVTFAANSQAFITSVKAHKARNERKEDFNTELAEVQLQDMMNQMWIALRCALCSIPWSSLTSDEKIAASQASIDQFSLAYMEFIPAYLDWLTEEYGEMEFMSRKPQEAKTGRTISAATADQLTSAHEHMKTAGDHCKSASDYLTALLNDEAVDGETIDDADTSKRKAAAASEPEPVEDHSAAESLMEDIRSLIPAA